MVRRLRVTTTKFFFRLLFLEHKIHFTQFFAFVFFFRVQALVFLTQKNKKQIRCIAQLCHELMRSNILRIEPICSNEIEDCHRRRDITKGNKNVDDDSGRVGEIKCENMERHLTSACDSISSFNRCAQHRLCVSKTT